MPAAAGGHAQAKGTPLRLQCGTISIDLFSPRSGVQPVPVPAQPNPRPVAAKALGVVRLQQHRPSPRDCPPTPGLPPHPSPALQDAETPRPWNQAQCRDRHTKSSRYTFCSLRLRGRLLTIPGSMPVGSTHFPLPSTEGPCGLTLTPFRPLTRPQTSGLALPQPPPSQRPHHTATQ